MLLSFLIAHSNFKIALIKIPNYFIWKILSSMKQQMLSHSLYLLIILERFFPRELFLSNSKLCEDCYNSSSCIVSSGNSSCASAAFYLNVLLIIFWSSWSRKKDNYFLENLIFISISYLRNNLLYYYSLKFFVCIIILISKHLELLQLFHRKNQVAILNY